jgi:membrane protein YdbS with pleckstrin-like domain
MNQPTEPSRHLATVHESAIDGWIAAILFLPAVLATGIGIYLFLAGNPGDGSILFLVAAATLLVTAAFTLPCRYTILSDALSVRCGLLCYQIPLDEIQSIEPTATWRSGPALSLRRVLVKTARRDYILSPQDRDQFTAQLNRSIQANSAAESTP